MLLITNNCTTERCHKRYGERVLVYVMNGALDHVAGRIKHGNRGSLAEVVVHRDKRSHSERSLIVKVARASWASRTLWSCRSLRTHWSDGTSGRQLNVDDDLFERHIEDRVFKDDIDDLV